MLLIAGSSHCCGFELGSSLMWDKPGSALQVVRCFFFFFFFFFLFCVCVCVFGESLGFTAQNE